MFFFLHVEPNDIIEHFNHRIPDSFGRDIEKACQSIYPLHDVFIRKVKVLKKPKFDGKHISLSVCCRYHLSTLRSWLFEKFLASAFSTKFPFKSPNNNPFTCLDMSVNVEGNGNVYCRSYESDNTSNLCYDGS